MWFIKANPPLRITNLVDRTLSHYKMNGNQSNVPKMLEYTCLFIRLVPCQQSESFQLYSHIRPHHTPDLHLNQSTITAHEFRPIISCIKGSP